MLTAVRTATRVSNGLSQKWNSLSCLSLKELLDTDYSLSWLGRIAGCLQKEWKGCFPGCQAKAVLSLKGLEVCSRLGICMGTGKIRATLMITQKKESPWLILLLYVGELRIAVWWSSFWWFFAQITYCSVAAMVLLPRLLERIGERECERGKIDFCWRDRRHIQRWAADIQCYWQSCKWLLLVWQVPSQGTKEDFPHIFPNEALFFRRCINGVGAY